MGQMRLPDEYQYHLEKARQKIIEARSPMGARQPYLRRLVPVYRASSVGAA